MWLGIFLVDMIFFYPTVVVIKSYVMRGLHMARVRYNGIDQRTVLEKKLVWLLQAT